MVTKKVFYPTVALISTPGSFLAVRLTASHQPALGLAIRFVKTIPVIF